MNQTDKRESEEVVFNEHRLAQVSAATNEYSGDEVGDKWISESDTCVSRIFRWKIIAECKAGDYAEVKRKIAEVVQQSGAQAGARPR